MTANGENNHTNGNGNGGGELTGLQRAFVDAWFECRFNGTEAAKQAGYQGDRRVLATAASKLLRKGKIQAAIAERWAEHGASGDEVAARLAGWMRFDISLLFSADGRLDWEKVRQYGENIKRITWDKGNKLSVEVHDPLRAAELLAKFLMVAEEKEKGGLQIVVDI